jgi:NhaA family Na+:H+ antiporter
MTNHLPYRMSNALRQFIQQGALSGIILLVVLAVALLVANSPLSGIYNGLVDMPVHISVGALSIKKPLLLWVNDGLMAVFFMLLAMEIKREIASGELSRPDQLAMPLMGAIGGIVLPAAIFYLFNHHDVVGRRGWPIPTTTDIAFVLGIIAILGQRVPASLKAMLVALSIVDDILAISVIAVFYTAKLSWIAMVAGVVGVMLLVIFNCLGIKRIAPYVLVGIVVWICVLKSGIHATLAGVLVGLTIPMHGKTAQSPSPLLNLEKALHPWVVFGIMPLFVFLNGGVAFTGFSLSSMVAAVPLGITLGLVLGKSIGALLGCGLAYILRLGHLPVNVSWRQLSAMCCLSGVGFTMSLFIAALAYTQTPFEDVSRYGVLVGSLISGLVGVGLFLMGPSSGSVAK